MKLTKRNLLSLLAGLFEPLGIISPMIVCMKILFQNLCCENWGWDEELEGNSSSEWIADLSNIEGISINRCIYERPKQEVLECELHGFGDASSKAYCTVVYLVYKTNEGTSVKLLTLKSQVAPLKKLTIPRLELMLARILAQLMDTVKLALESQLKVNRVRHWLESSTALCWIQNRGEWKQFVRHRVNEILKLRNKEHWGHCPGKENPADIGLRGALGSKLRDDKMWWCGPQWLTQGEEKWPATVEDICTPESEEELKKTTNVMVVQVQRPPTVANLVDINRHGSLGKLLGVTTLVLRFINNARPDQDQTFKRRGRLKREELVQAEGEWLKAAQADLRRQGNFQNLVSELGLIENDRILRCVGRLINSDLEVDVRRPIILPRDHAYTTLVIWDCHERVLHSGMRATLADMHSRYWVPKGRQCVKKVLSKCVTCKKQEGRAFSAPLTAALPEFRVKQVPAF